MSFIGQGKQISSVLFHQVCLLKVSTYSKNTFRYMFKNVKLWINILSLIGKFEHEQKISTIKNSLFSLQYGKTRDLQIKL